MWAAVQEELGVEVGNPLGALPLTHWVRVSLLNSELTDTAGLTFWFVWGSPVD